MEENTHSYPTECLQMQDPTPTVLVSLCFWVHWTKVLDDLNILDSPESLHLVPENECTSPHVAKRARIFDLGPAVGNRLTASDLPVL
jgi:hypothetical protein